MFTLRKITGGGAEINFFLGRSYTLITKERNPEEFRSLFDHLKYSDEPVYGFVSDEDGRSLALFSTQQNYIMVAGKTVDNLTI